MKLFALALAGVSALASAALLATPGFGFSSGRSADPVNAWRDANFVVTRTGRLPTGCGLRQLAQVVSSSWTAFNRGDIAKSVSLFADASGRSGQPFRVFSAIEAGRRVNVSSRRSVAAFLTRRYQDGDRLHLDPRGLPPSPHRERRGAEGVGLEHLLVRRRAHDATAERLRPCSRARARPSLKLPRDAPETQAESFKPRPRRS
jgi:hypothetical protein